MWAGQTSLAAELWGAKCKIKMFKNVANSDFLAFRLKISINILLFDLLFLCFNNFYQVLNLNGKQHVNIKFWILVGKSECKM